MKFNVKKLIGLLVFLLMALVLSAANLDELRWVPKNREALSKLIDENKNKGNYVIFLNFNKTSTNGGMDSTYNIMDRNRGNFKDNSNFLCGYISNNS